jgi:hypothetical protein
MKVTAENYNLFVCYNFKIILMQFSSSIDGKVEMLSCDCSVLAHKTE